MTPTYSEVIYETQPSFVVHECLGHRCLRKAAVDVNHSGGFVHHGSRCSSGFLEHDDEHSSRGSVQPVNDPAARLEQRLCDTASG